MKKDVKNRLRTWLLQGKSITSNEALKRFRTSRLAVYIRRLRKEGLNISTEMVYKNGDCFGRYRHEI